MADNYYCLVAGLKDYTLEGDAKGFDARTIIDEIAEQLSAADLGALRTFLLFNDICNMLNMRGGRSDFSTLGNFSREELDEELKSPARLPQPLADVLRAYNEPDNSDFDEVDTSGSIERALFEAYYVFCAKSKCKFLREWSEADRNLRNITAALAARKRGTDPADVLVGGGDIVAQIARSSAADFGLKDELPYMDGVLAALSDNGNMLEKEHRIDMVRWSLAEEMVLFDYFNINTVLSYIERISLVHRWAALDEKRGREMFGRLMESLGGKEQIAAAIGKNRYENR